MRTIPEFAALDAELEAAVDVASAETTPETAVVIEQAAALREAIRAEETERAQAAEQLVAGASNALQFETVARVGPSSWNLSIALCANGTRGSLQNLDCDALGS